MEPIGTGCPSGPPDGGRVFHPEEAPMTGIEAWAIGATVVAVAAIQALRDGERDVEAVRAEGERELQRMRVERSEEAARHAFELGEIRRRYRLRLMALVRAARKWRAEANHGAIKNPRG